jgi:hypothetical protein
MEADDDDDDDADDNDWILLEENENEAGQFSFNWNYICDSQVFLKSAIDTYKIVCYSWEFRGFLSLCVWCGLVVAKNYVTVFFRSSPHF